MTTASINPGAIQVDLRLEESKDGFVPRHPLVDTKVGSLASNGVSFPDANVTLTPVGANIDAAGTEVDGRVVYHGIARDTDYVIVPMPGGVESSWVLFSADSPEKLPLQVNMPGGATLRRAVSKDPIPGDPPRSAQVVKDGKVLMTINAPIAFDADGLPLDVDVDIDGNRVTFAVEHVGEDVHYPLHLDPVSGPEVIPSRGNNIWAGWNFFQNPGTPNRVASDYNYNYYGAKTADCDYYCSGIYMSMPTNTFYDPRHTFGQFYYKAPVGTHIYRTVFGYVSHSAYVYGGNSFSREYHGLMNGMYSGWEPNVSLQDASGSTYQVNPFGPAPYSFTNAVHDMCFNARCNRLGGSDSNSALFTISATNDVNAGVISTASSRATATMYYAQVFLGDENAPTSTVVADRTWFDDENATTTLTTSGHDDGLGVYAFNVTGPNGTKVTRAKATTGDLSKDCTGDPELSRCPKDRQLEVNYQLNEGSNWLTYNVVDPVAQYSTTRGVTMLVDRTEPSAVGFAGLSPSDDEIYLNGSGDLSAAADDPPGAHASSATTRAGIAKLELMLDGAAVGSSMAGTQVASIAGTGCSGACTAQAVLHYDMSTVPLESTGSPCVQLTEPGTTRTRTTTSSPMARPCARPPRNTEAPMDALIRRPKPTL